VINSAVVDNGLLYGGGATLLIKQFAAVGATLAYSFIVSFILAKIVDKMIGLRVTEEKETVGLDESLHSERAYQVVEMV
jgi:Amt family ammonium transporter